MGLGKLLDLEVRERPWDGWLLLIILTFIVIGVIMIYSASAITSYWDPYQLDEFFYLKRQLFSLGIGLVAMILGMKIDYRVWRERIYWILGLVVLLLGAVLVIGSTIKGAQRWIRIPGVGFNLQPAEVAKILVSFVMAYFMAKQVKEGRIQKFAYGIVPPVILLGICGLLLLMQPDFGSTVLLASMTGAMLVFAGTNLILMGFGVVLLGSVATLLIATSAYRMERVTAFLDPWSHQQDSGYQLIESISSIVHGGVNGQGLGEGLSKLGFVPELHTDFIGVIIAEEFGFWGILGIIILYILFASRGFLIAMRARDYFGRYVAFGITFILTMQAALNLCVISGLAPTKGFTMPFVSYGGSSLIMCLFAVGVLLNISKCQVDTISYEKERKAKEKKDAQWHEKRKRILTARRNG